MASLAEMMVGGAMQSAQTQGQGQADGLAKGASLAIQKEQNEIQKAQLQKQQQELGSAKYQKFVEAIDKGVKYEGVAQKNYYKQVLPRYRDALGLTAEFPNEIIDFTTSTPQNLARIQTIIARTRDPKDPLSEKEAIALINDPVAFGDVTPEFLDDTTAKLAEAAKTKINAQSQIAQLQQSAQQFQQGQSATQRRADDQAKQELQKKRADANIPGLRVSFNAVDKLIPGGLDGWQEGTQIPGVTGADSKQPMNWNSPSGVKMRQAAQGLANQLLKMRSGGAVSDGEATRLLAEIGMTPSIGEGGSWTTLFKGTPTAATFVNGVKGIRDVVDAQDNELRAAYGDQLYNQVVRQGAPAQRQAPPPAGGTPPPAGKRNAAELDNPTFKEKLKAAVSSAPAELAKAAQAYGLTPDALKAKLGF